MKLNELKPREGSVKDPIRVGRGIGSGKGKTCGSGHKGQNARTGVAIKGFEGGQMPLFRRMPKRGFTSPNKKDLVNVSLTRLQEAVDKKLVDPKKPLDEAALKKAGVIRRVKDGVKILGQGTLKAKLDLNVTGASESARRAIEEAGGKVTVKQVAEVQPQE